MYKTIGERIGVMKSDFVVSYEFTDPERLKFLPYQGYRCDFMYADDLENHQAYMIVPEFLDDKKEVIISTQQHVPIRGYAGMWVVPNEMLGFHESKIKIGTKGFFIEGNKRVAECIVIEVGTFDRVSK